MKEIILNVEPTALELDILINKACCNSVLKNRLMNILQRVTGKCNLTFRNVKFYAPIFLKKKLVTLPFSLTADDFDNEIRYQIAITDKNVIKIYQKKISDMEYTLLKKQYFIIGYVEKPA